MGRSIHTEPHNRLTQLLRQTRLDAGLTQEAVADRLRRPQSFVSKYESGERRLDLVELEEVAEAIGIDLEELVNQYRAAGRRHPRQG